MLSAIYIVVIENMVFLGGQFSLGNKRKSAHKSESPVAGRKAENCKKICLIGVKSTEMSFIGLFKGKV